MSNYSTTFTGLIVILLGVFGLGDLISNEQVGELVNAVIQIIGIIVAAYGRYRAGGVTPLGFRK